MGEVLLQRRHFESGGFFNGFLQVQDFLLLGEFGVFVHFLIALEGCGYNGCNCTLLLFAEFLSAFDVVGGKALFHGSDKLGDVAFAFGGVKSEETFNRKNDNGEEKGLKNRHDETAFVDGAPDVLRMAVFVEVHVSAEPEDEQANGYHCAGNDYPDGVLDAGNIGFLVVSNLCGLGGNIGLLSFHSCF